MPPRRATRTRVAVTVSLGCPPAYELLAYIDQDYGCGGKDDARTYNTSLEAAVHQPGHGWHDSARQWLRGKRQAGTNPHVSPRPLCCAALGPHHRDPRHALKSGAACAISTGNPAYAGAAAQHQRHQRGGGGCQYHRCAGNH